MSDKKILAFYAPYSGAGKSTAAKNVTGLYYPLALSFADPLYRCAEYINYIFVNASESEKKNEPRYEFGGKTLREFLIHFGQAGREFYPNIWVDTLQREMQRHKDRVDIIIDDLRFRNEYAMLRKEGAKIVRITNLNREVIKTETEGLLEDCLFDYELVNYKRGLDRYQAQLDEMMSKLWP